MLAVVRIGVPVGIKRAITAATSDNGRPAVLKRIVFAIPVNDVGALVGDSAPARIAIKAGVTGRYIKA